MNMDELGANGDREPKGRCSGVERRRQSGRSMTARGRERRRRGRGRRAWASGMGFRERRTVSLGSILKMTAMEIVNMVKRAGNRRRHRCLGRFLLFDALAISTPHALLQRSLPRFPARGSAMILVLLQRLVPPTLTQSGSAVFPLVPRRSPPHHQQTQVPLPRQFLMETALPILFRG
ncbi:hypothetical protein BD779DRAFT_225332 [Infundibulicybe gibba]|nr:hypothetical protein BD779DRAFT_225332 [Infundibulicybe gibba]